MNEQLSHLSDLALEGAMAGYLVALVCHAIENASRRTRRSSMAPVAAGARQAAGGASGSAGGVAVLDRPESAPTSPERGSRWVPLPVRFGRAAVVVTTLGLLFHIAALVLRGMAAGRGPWGNMYEFTMMITCAAVATWLVVLWRTGARTLGVYVMTPVVVLVFLAGTVLYTQSSPLQPILNTYWLHVHVVTISLSSGVLMFSGLASAAYLARFRHDRKVAAAVSVAAADGSITDHDGAAENAGSTAVDAVEVAPTKLPSLDKLDRLAYRSAIVAFPFYTFAIIAGALWAEVAWGAYWSWDPKEVAALVSWVIYAGYLHARATAGWRGRPAAWISVLGFASIVFNLFFINIVVPGMHSYSGLN